jgi:hypothetical protein
MYSVDMIKLKAYPDLTNHKGQLDKTYFNQEHEIVISELIGLENYLRFKKTDNITYWPSNKYTGYRHNWKIEYPDKTSFYVGYRHNAEKMDRRHQLSIKYNPNKLEVGFHLGLSEIISKCKPIQITSVDLAFDIQKNINNLVIEKPKYIEKYKYWEEKGAKTHYFGTRKNLIKVYDKAMEMGLKKGYPLTRIEWTLPVKNNIINKAQIRDIKIYSLGGYQVSIDSEKVDETLNAVLYAVLNGYDVNRLSRRYRDKVKKYLHSAGTLVDIDKDLMLKSFYDYLDYLNSL